MRPHQQKEVKMQGIVFEIQRFCLHDGPGIRTNIFMKGCTLRCRWCHNPEGQTFEPQVMFNSIKCIGCGRCDGKDPDKCFSKARTWAGVAYTPEELAKLALADKEFWQPEGGVTFSGGEPLAQSKFLAEVMAILQKEGVSIAIETAGHVPWENFEDVLPYDPLFLFDVKCADPELHKEQTGVDNRVILENLRKLSQAGGRFWVRTPVVGGVNDNPEEILAIADIIRSLPNPPQFVELLQYHKLGQHKHEMIGTTSVMDDTAEVSKERMAELSALVPKM